jgi:stage II sporulation protein P
MLNGLRPIAVALALVLGVVLVPGAPGSTAVAGLAEQFDELVDREIAEELYYRMVDEEGRTIIHTGRRLEPGDQYLSGDNRLYEVERVDGRVGYARYLRTFSSEPETVFSGLGGGAGVGTVPVQGLPNRRIAVYHTHNGESYFPERGKVNVDGRGDVHRVGKVFRETLEEQGVEVIHKEDIHLPHDRGAYRRARDTALDLLAEEPDAIFDIHRDAAPWYAYAEKVDGEWVAQIMFVVGRQNPHFAVNRSFAFDLKRFIDGVHPGLIRGVFIANGNYNQDLHPLKLLLEVGSHENTLRAAKEGITRFAEGVRLYLYGPEAGPLGRAPVQEQDRAPVWRNILLVLLVVGVAGGGFYWLNNPEAAKHLVKEANKRAATLTARIRGYLKQKQR